MIPVYPFQVMVDRYMKGGAMSRRTSSFADLSAAWDYSTKSLKHPATRRVQVMVVISDTRPETGGTNGHTSSGH